MENSNIKKYKKNSPIFFFGYRKEDEYLFTCFEREEKKEKHFLMKNAMINKKNELMENNNINVMMSSMNTEDFFQNFEKKYNNISNLIKNKVDIYKQLRKNQKNGVEYFRYYLYRYILSKYNTTNPFFNTKNIPDEIKELLKTNKTFRMQFDKQEIDKFFQQSNIKKIEGLLGKFIIHVLMELCIIFLDMEEDDFPNLRRDLCHMITYKLLNKISPMEKRKFEQKEIKRGYDNQFFSMCFYQKNKKKKRKKEKVIPKDLIYFILKYCEKNKHFLNSVALLNQKWYCVCLESWDKLKISKDNVYLIPLIVLQYVINVFIISSSSMYVKELKYIHKHIQRAKELTIRGDIKKFFKFLSIPLTRVQSLTLTLRGDMHKNVKNLPNLKYFNITCAQCEDMNKDPIYQQLKGFSFGTISNNNITLPNWITTLKKLEFLKIQNTLDNFEILTKVSSGIIHLDLHISNFSKNMELWQQIVKNPLCNVQTFSCVYHSVFDNVGEFEKIIYGLYSLRQLYCLSITYRIQYGQWDTRFNKLIHQWKIFCHYILYAEGLKNIQIQICFPSNVGDIKKKIIQQTFKTLVFTFQRTMKKRFFFKVKTKLQNNNINILHILTLAPKPGFLWE
jgi:hypothetical protein